MTKTFWTKTEIIEHFQVDINFLSELEAEEIICPVCGTTPDENLLSAQDMEKLRVARILYEEMDVNIPGIEIILQMRQNMLDMRKQFDAILEDLAERLQKKLEGSC